MCDLCLQNPCPENCPNAPERIAVLRCDACGAYIRDGDEYIRVNGGDVEADYCSSCAWAKTAEAEDDDDPEMEEER